MSHLPRELQPLLDQFTGEGLVVSCYVDLSPPPGVALSWPGPFTAKAAAVQTMLADNSRDREQFEQDYTAIGRVVTAPEARRNRGIAVFAAGQRGFLQSFPLDVPVENELVVHQAPYLVPLLEVLCSRRTYLAVWTDTHRGRLYAAAPGGVRLLHEVQEDVPSRQHSAGQRWGKEQATIARHRDDRILHYQKELVQTIDKTWTTETFHGIALLGAHELLEHVRKQLPQRLADHVVYEGPLAWTPDAQASADSLRKVATEVRRVEEERVVQRLESGVQRGLPIAVGAHDVLNAVQTSKIGRRGHGCVILGPDPREAVSRCTVCRSLFFDMPATCSRCQAACSDANLWEELILMALRHDIVVHCVKKSNVMQGLGGFAAILGPSRA
jgi:peptide subunit release factor 1 (eRF1)